MSNPTSFVFPQPHPNTPQRSVVSACLLGGNATDTCNYLFRCERFTSKFSICFLLAFHFLYFRLTRVGREREHKTPASVRQTGGQRFGQQANLLLRICLCFVRLCITKVTTTPCSYVTTHRALAECVGSLRSCSCHFVSTVKLCHLTASCVRWAHFTSLFCISERRPPMISNGCSGSNVFVHLCVLLPCHSVHFFPLVRTSANTKSS